MNKGAKTGCPSMMARISKVGLNLWVALNGVSLVVLLLMVLMAIKTVFFHTSFCM